jgi:hypothetical protein
VPNIALRSAGRRASPMTSMPSRAAVGASCFGFLVITAVPAPPNSNSTDRWARPRPVCRTLARRVCIAQQEPRLEALQASTWPNSDNGPEASAERGREASGHLDRHAAVLDRAGRLGFVRARARPGGRCVEGRPSPGSSASGSDARRARVARGPRPRMAATAVGHRPSASRRWHRLAIVSALPSRIEACAPARARLGTPGVQDLPARRGSATRPPTARRRPQAPVIPRVPALTPPRPEPPH